MENSILNIVHRSPKQKLKTLNKFKNVCVVLGNETCDLDSAVSCLIYSLFLHSLNRSLDNIIIPVFNIPRRHLPIKTEVVYVLTKYGFQQDDIVCRDEIDLKSLQRERKLQLTLVDHHVLNEENLKDSVVEVIDHRPQDPAWPWPNAKVTMNPVGSCCTLVAEKLLSEAPQLLTPVVATWLLGTILLDTGCLSPLVGRATALDLKVSTQLLKSYCHPTLDKVSLYKELMIAKRNISSLTTAQLLIKDLKMASGIPIAGLPIKVKAFLDRPDSVSAVYQLCSEHNVDVCVIYGQDELQGTILRDIAVFGTANSSTAPQVISALVDSTEPFLNLLRISCDLEGFTTFEQLNVAATRKQVLPIVQNVAKMSKKP